MILSLFLIMKVAKPNQEHIATTLFLHLTYVLLNYLIVISYKIIMFLRCISRSSRNFLVIIAKIELDNGRPHSINATRLTSYLRHIISYYLCLCIQQNEYFKCLLRYQNSSTWFCATMCTSCISCARI